MGFEIHNKRPDVRKPGETCDTTGCNNPVRWQVAIIIPYKDSKIQPLEFEVGLYQCDQCGKKLDAKTFLTDEGWQMISEAVAGCRRPVPERSLAKMNLKPVLRLA